MAIPGFTAQHSDYQSALGYASVYGPDSPGWSTSWAVEGSWAGGSGVRNSWVELAQSCNSGAIAACVRSATQAFSVCMQRCGARPDCRQDCALDHAEALAACRAVGCPAGYVCRNGSCVCVAVMRNGACVAKTTSKPVLR